MNEKIEMSREELAAEKERAKLEYETKNQSSAAAPLDYGRWGERRLKFMEENILNFWNVYPQSLSEKKKYLEDFNQQCLLIYNDIYDKAKSDPNSREGDYMTKANLLTQADLTADEIILHELVYNELYNGFSSFEHITWDSYYATMSSAVEKVTPELKNHWRYMWETYDKKHSD